MSKCLQRHLQTPPQIPQKTYTNYWTFEKSLPPRTTFKNNPFLPLSTQILLGAWEGLKPQCFCELEAHAKFQNPGQTILGEMYARTHYTTIFIVRYQLTLKVGVVKVLSTSLPELSKGSLHKLDQRGLPVIENSEWLLLRQFLVLLYGIPRTCPQSWPEHWQMTG